MRSDRGKNLSGEDVRKQRRESAQKLRRRLLKVMGWTALGCLLPGSSRAIEIAALDNPAGEIGPASEGFAHTLALYNTHTHESLITTFWRDGRYIPRALASIDHILRDHRTDQVRKIDPRLLDLLAMLTARLGARDPIQIVSGYRSPATNEALRRRGRGVAKNSLHTSGKAVDIKLPDITLATLRREALELRAGGVGYYPRSGFVHLDVGDIRSW